MKKRKSPTLRVHVEDNVIKVYHDTRTERIIMGSVFVKLVVWLSARSRHWDNNYFAYLLCLVSCAAISLFWFFLGVHDHYMIGRFLYISLAIFLFLVGWFLDRHTYNKIGEVGNRFFMGEATLSDLSMLQSLIGRRKSLFWQASFCFVLDLLYQAWKYEMLWGPYLALVLSQYWCTTFTKPLKPERSPAQAKSQLIPVPTHG